MKNKKRICVSDRFTTSFVVEIGTKRIVSVHRPRRPRGRPTRSRTPQDRRPCDRSTEASYYYYYYFRWTRRVRFVVGRSRTRKRTRPGRRRYFAIGPRLEGTTVVSVVRVLYVVDVRATGYCYRARIMYTKFRRYPPVTHKIRFRVRADLRRCGLHRRLLVSASRRAPTSDVWTDAALRGTRSDLQRLLLLLLLLVSDDFSCFAFFFFLSRFVSPNCKHDEAYGKSDDRRTRGPISFALPVSAGHVRTV